MGEHRGAWPADALQGFWSLDLHEQASVYRIILGALAVLRVLQCSFFLAVNVNLLCVFANEWTLCGDDWALWQREALGSSRG